MAWREPDNTETSEERPGTVEDLTRRNVELVGQIEQAELERRSGMDRAIDAITAFCGSTWFVWLHLVWFSSWLVVNVVPGMPHFDKYPFEFLTLVVSLEAIMLSTFILITQNRQAALADRRNHLDLQINMLSEQENTKILLLLDRIAEKLGIDESDDPELRMMEERSHPERMVQQIEESMKTPGQENQDSGNEAQEDREKALR